MSTVADIAILSDSKSLAIKYLKQGQVVAVPTDTVYGLACNAYDISAINKLYAIKQRNENKPVAICVGRVKDVKTWAVVDHLPNGLLSALLPGPVTLILTCANKLDKSVVFNGKVGIRIPDYSFIRDLANGLGKPLALTSANLSNEPSALTVDEFKVLWDKVSGVFDGGRLGLDRSASTIVDLSKPGTYHILREGIALKETTSILTKFGLVIQNE